MKSVLMECVGSRVAFRKFVESRSSIRMGIFFKGCMVEDM